MPSPWDDEAPDWGADTPEEAPAAAPAAAGEAKDGAAPADGAAAAPADGEVPVEDPDSLEGHKYNRHWVRPKFLQYSYLYDYRKNYYDDVIDYLDRRQHGMRREIPRPQTWAERVLRTYNNKLGVSATTLKTKLDNQLITSLHHTRQISSQYTKSYYHKVFTIAY